MTSDASPNAAAHDMCVYQSAEYPSAAARLPGDSSKYLRRRR